MSTVAAPARSSPAAAESRLGRLSWAWVGVVPFFAFAIMFLILPTSFLAVGGFQDSQGRFTLQNIANLNQPTIIKAYRTSIAISAASAFGGALIGFGIAYAVALGRVPRWIRPTMMTFSGVASNFAGVPLAFAFMATLGRTGLVTALLTSIFGFNIYRYGFNLLSFGGLTLTFVRSAAPKTAADLQGRLDVGSLKGAAGNMNYLLERKLDLKGQNALALVTAGDNPTVVGYAPLTKP